MTSASAGLETVYSDSPPYRRCCNIIEQTISPCDHLSPPFKTVTSSLFISLFPIFIPVNLIPLTALPLFKLRLPPPVSLPPLCLLLEPDMQPISKRLWSSGHYRLYSCGASLGSIFNNIWPLLSRRN